MSPAPDGSVSRVREEITDADVRIVPANEATWADVDAVFDGSDARKCRCQRFRTTGWIWRDTTQPERVAALREQTACDDPASPVTSGLIAYLGDEPVGWVAVEPRVAYPKLRTLRMPWAGRPDEDRDDPGVWAVTCFVVRKGHRGRGLTYVLARAAVEHARSRGATAVEGYGMITPPGKTITWGELHVGAVQAFTEAGMRTVHQPSIRRVVLRVDF